MTTIAPYIYVPFPLPPVLPGQECETCDGSGITGELYGMDAAGGRTLLIDVFCPDCDGCGSANHRACVPQMHASYSADEDGPWSAAYPEEDHELNDRAVLCGSCQDRGWNATEGFPSEIPDDDQISGLYIRMPCGCTEHRARRLHADELMDIHTNVRAKATER